VALTLGLNSEKVSGTFNPRVKSGESTVRPMPAVRLIVVFGLIRRPRPKFITAPVCIAVERAATGLLLASTIVMREAVVTFSWNDTLVDTLYDSAYVKPAPKPIVLPGRRPVRMLPSAGLYWCRLLTDLPAPKLSEPNSTTGSNTCDALMPTLACA